MIDDKPIDETDDVILRMGDTDLDWLEFNDDEKAKRLKIMARAKEILARRTSA